MYKNAVRLDSSRHKYWYPLPADIWAAGITFFGSMTGNVPWQKALQFDRNFRDFAQDKDDHYFKEYIERGELDENEVEMLKRMWEIDAEKRITATMLLMDPWFQSLKDTCPPNIVMEVLSVAS